MKKLIVAGVIAILYSCGGDEVAPDCILQSAVASYPGSNSSEKYVYAHNGSNYYEIMTYVESVTTGIFPSEPTYTTQITYNSMGVETVKETETQDPGNYDLYEYSYDIQAAPIIWITIRWTRVEAGVVQSNSTWKEHYVENGGNELYLIQHASGESTIEQFSNGNLIAVGVEDLTGTFTAFGKKWTFEVEYKYDGSLNVFHEYILQRLISQPNLGHCTNIMVEEITRPSSPISRKQTFEFLDEKRLKQWFGSSGRTIIFEYTCQ